MDHPQSPDGTDVVDRLMAATNAHDLDALVGCFADDYVLTDPVHPNRSFTGTGQVARNWAAIFAGVPDVTSRVLHRADVPAAGRPGESTSWLELEMTGTRRDGAPHELAGVMVFGIREDRIVSGRFFLQPVEHGGPDADGAVRTAMQGRQR